MTARSLLPSWSQCGQFFAAERMDRRDTVLQSGDVHCLRVQDSKRWHHTRLLPHYPDAGVTVTFQITLLPYVGRKWSCR
jgi:hypothetical protein